MAARRALKLDTLVLTTLLLLFYGASGTHCSVVHGNTSDRRSLLDFKEAITDDPTGALRDWNDSIHHCMWSGVNCSTRHPGRVTMLDLPDLNLTGQITPSIANLTFLKELNLTNNHFSGRLPPLNRLRKLDSIFLSGNLLQGNISDAFTALANCSKLTWLDLGANMLVGSIPRNIGPLSGLLLMDLSENNLTGNIPPALSNITHLKAITFVDNQLEGSITEEIGQLPYMWAVLLRGNRLSGRVPATLFNLSHLQILDLSMNMLSGHIPHSAGNLSTTLVVLNLEINNLSGTIPPSIEALKNLQQLKLRGNNFAGPLP